MNILVVNVSPLPRENKENSYEVHVADCDVQQIHATQTNESIIKCLSHYVPLKQTGGINKIIALVSSVVGDKKNESFGGQTAFNYYRQKVNECGYDPDYIEIRYEDLDTASILKLICENIQAGDIVYIDSAGGQRTISNIIQVLTNILKYKGIENQCTLYSSFQQGSSPYIESTASHMRMLDLADAMNEFMTTGKADQLKHCFEGRVKNTAMNSLLSAMSDFSDKIRLGTVEALDETIDQLSNAITGCQANQSSNEIETVILNQFLPIIEEKLLGTKRQEVDYIQIIKWCLDNVLIQQALTIFVEKVPRLLFKKGFIRYNGNIAEQRALHAEAREKNPSLPADWEAYVLTSEILATAQERLAKDCIAELNGSKTTNEIAKKVANSILKFREIDFRKNRKHKSSTMQAISNFIAEKKFTTYEKFLKALTNGIPGSIWETFAGLPSTDHQDPLTKRIMAIQNIRGGGFHSNDFSFGIPNNMIASICAGYMYVKAIRNQTNHASSEENLSSENKKYLETFGYDFSDNSLKTVTKNIRHALKQIPL